MSEALDRVVEQLGLASAGGGLEEQFGHALKDGRTLLGVARAHRLLDIEQQ